MSKSIYKKSPEVSKSIISFNPGIPDTSLFPAYTWGKFLKEACLYADSSDFEYPDASGHIKLKTALCQYLYSSKGIYCHPEQIFIVSGTASALSLLSNLYHKPEDKVIAIEDPSIDFVKHIFGSKGYLIHPIPVDNQGLISSELEVRCISKPRFIYTVPSHQFPTGSILSATRRMELLNYVRENQAYILEDDYDSEFTYHTRPVQSLYSLDHNHTIYLGTFSKIFSPSIRLGYMIVPPNLIDTLNTIGEQHNIRPEIFTQLAMADFIHNKYLDRHIYKAKKIYNIKRQQLISCLYKCFQDNITICGEDAGLHLLVSFHFDLPITLNLMEYGIAAEFARNYSLSSTSYNNHLIIGFAGLSLQEIETGINQLYLALKPYIQNRT